MFPWSKPTRWRAIKTNLFGTRNVANAALAAGASACVMISTDKAVNPTNIMGATKRAAEAYCQALDVSSDKIRYKTVRFGNVLGSNGSVVPRFQEQIASGGPLTVTHPQVVRFFMTIPEAVRLVLHASAHAQRRQKERGKIMVLDMGEPVRIVHLAERMIQLAGLKPYVDIDIVFTGLRPGEKLYEELFDPSEVQSEVTDGRICRRLAARHRQAAARKVALRAGTGRAERRRGAGDRAVVAYRSGIQRRRACRSRPRPAGGSAKPKSVLQGRLKRSRPFRAAGLSVRAAVSRREENSARCALSLENSFPLQPLRVSARLCRKDMPADKQTSVPTGFSVPVRTIADSLRRKILPEGLLQGASMTIHLSHLQRLEAEAIHIFREVAANFANPVMLYSVGKDSSVLLHLAMKAFFPAKPPFPFLHVDTTWKFREMIAFRDQMAAKLGFDLLVHTNEDGVRQNINPFDHGSNTYTHVMKTVALRQALDKYGFDAAFGGARRDEEKSRAKERIFSFRNAQHSWDPKHQRPEMWKIYNTRVSPGRIDPRLPAVQLDRARYLAVHPAGGHPDRAALFRQDAAGRRARRHADHGR